MFSGCVVLFCRFLGKLLRFSFETIVRISIMSTITLGERDFGPEEPHVT